MAFPTSPSDNQVYKIGNRRWVYDSTLGVWDKVAANDTNISDQTGTLGSNITLGSGVTFPAGHVIQTRIYSTGTQTTLTSSSFNTGDVMGDFQFTPIKASSNILLWATAIVYASTSAVGTYVDFYKNASDVTETANLSGHTNGLGIARFEAVWPTVSYFFLDTCAENSLTEKTYKISGKTVVNGNTGYLGVGSATPSKMVIQEITT
jgi:hypothetical protein